MNEKDLSEQQLSTEQLVKGKLIDAWRDTVRLPDGTTGVREYIKHPGAVIILPLFEGGMTMLVRQFRYAVGKTFLELPAGKLDKGESPEVAVQRELSEEIGYKSHRLEQIAEFHPCIGYSNEKMWFYVATQLEAHSLACEDDEFLEIVRMSYVEALKLVHNGEITDLKTMVGLLLAKDFVETHS